MKIWLRIAGYEPCSWSFVWARLKDAFEADGDEICDFVSEPSDPENFVEVWWGDPQFWQWSKLPVKAKVAIALSESRSILRQGRGRVIKNISAADVLICPSRSATLAFLEAPIETPIRVVPFGVDPEEHPYVKRDWEGTFKFFHGGVTQFRKGSWLVPEAFISAFDRSDDVRLTVASLRVLPMFMELRHEYGKHPQIDFISDYKDSAQEFYASHHAYVSPHLSEGFALMPLEAMSSGMVCLVARCSAPREYFREEFGCWIEMSEMYAPVDACLPDTAGFWRLPDVESLAAGMREVHAMRQQSKERGAKASKFVHEQMTWAHTVRAIKSIIKEILNEETVGDTAGLQRGEVVADAIAEHRAAC